jgi:hypothetical protein
MDIHRLVMSERPWRDIAVKAPHFGLMAKLWI